MTKTHTPEALGMFELHLARANESTQWRQFHTERAYFWLRRYTKQSALGVRACVLPLGQEGEGS